MALRREYKKRIRGITMRSGYFYKFKYQAWENDPNPTIIFMYGITGIHPNTGHQWRIIQAINFTYIPRGIRKRFMNIWLKELQKSKNIKFTWQKVLSRYPFLKIGIRRYFFKPVYYIKNLEEIPLEEVEKAVVSTYGKDFAKKVRTAILSKWAKILGRKKDENRKRRRKIKQTALEQQRKRRR